MKNILDKATITEKANQLLAELRANPVGQLMKKISNKVI